MLLQRINPPRRTRMHRIATVAASVAALVCLAWGGIHLWHYYAEQNVNYLQVSTSFGERKRVTLPDGSDILLNSCTHLSYPEHFLGSNRTVELTGEAFFQVERNEKQPFVVSTKQFDVEVLGTAFNVRSYESDRISSVQVESGKVQVDMPEGMLRLSTHEYLRMDAQKGSVEKKSNMRSIAEWRKGCLRFNNTPLSDVLRELERIYGCRIYYEQGKSFDNLISGEHDNVSLQAVLHSLEQTAGLTFREDGKRIYLYKK